MFASNHGGGLTAKKFHNAPVHHAATPAPSRNNIHPPVYHNPIRSAPPAHRQTNSRDALIDAMHRKAAPRGYRKAGGRGNFMPTLKNFARHQAMPISPISGMLGQSVWQGMQDPNNYVVPGQGGGQGPFDFINTSNLPGMPSMPSVNPWHYASPYVPQVPWHQSHQWDPNRSRNGGNISVFNPSP